MTETENKKISVTLKGGKDFDAPWIVFYGDSIADVGRTLDDPNLDKLTTRVAEVAALFKGAVTVVSTVQLPPANQSQPTPPAAPASQQQPQAPQTAWGSQPPAQQQQQYSQQPPQQGGNLGACGCGEPLQLKTGHSNRGAWQKKQCPNWRWNNGNPTPEHVSEFIQ